MHVGSCPRLWTTGDQVVDVVKYWVSVKLNELNAGVSNCLKIGDSSCPFWHFLASFWKQMWAKIWKSVSRNRHKQSDPFCVWWANSLLCSYALLYRPMCLPVKAQRIVLPSSRVGEEPEIRKSGASGLPYVRWTNQMNLVQYFHDHTCTKRDEMNGTKSH